MSEMKLYIANLGKYNEGEMVGNWYSLPLDIEKIYCEISIGSIVDGKYVHGVEIDDVCYEEYIILDTDFELFNVGMYASLKKINEDYETCELIAEEAGYDIESDDFKYLLETIGEFAGNDVDSMYMASKNMGVYYDCESITDYARFVAEEYGLSERMLDYLDYQLFCDELESSDFFGDEEYADITDGQKIEIATDLLNMSNEEEQTRYVDFEKYSDEIQGDWFLNEDLKCIIWF